MFLLAPFFYRSFAKFQTAFILVIFYFLMLLNINSHIALKNKFSFSVKFIAPSAIMFSLGAVEIAHFNIGGAIYFFFSFVAFFAGFLMKSLSFKPGKQILLIQAILLIIISFKFKFDQLDSDIILTSNFLGGVVFIVFSLWYVLQGEQRLAARWFWLLMLGILSISMTRSLMLGVIIGIFLSYFSFRSTFRMLASVFIGSFVAILTIENIELIKEIYYSMDLLAMTGKNLETGRGDIWMSILQSMSLSDYFIGGFDIKALPQLDAGGGKQLSAHNGYVSSLAQNGFLGLIGLLALPITIGIQNYNKNDPQALFFVAFVIAFFVREFFEVTVHGNNFPIVGPFWFICGLLISRTINSESVLRSTRVY